MAAAMSDLPAPPGAYEAAKTAYVVTANRPRLSDPSQHDLWPALVAAVDAVWPLGVAEGRRRAAVDTSQAEGTVCPHCGRTLRPVSRGGRWRLPTHMTNPGTGDTRSCPGTFEFVDRAAEGDHG